MHPETKTLKRDRRAGFSTQRPFFGLEAAIGWLGVGAVAFMLIGFVVFALNMRDRIYAEAEARAVGAVQVLAEHGARLFDAADLVVKRTAEMVEKADWGQIDASRPLWLDLQREGKRFPYIEAIWLNDATGRLRLSTLAFPTPASNAADRDFFLAHAESAPGRDEPYVSQLIVGRVTGMPTFAVSRRLGDGDGQFRGIASVTVNAAYFAQFYRSMDLPYAPVIRLFREVDKGVLVSEPPEATASDGDPGRISEALRQAVAASPQAGTVRGDRRLRAFRRLQDWPLYVAVGMDSRLIDAAWADAMMPYAASGGAAVAALLMMSVFAFRQARAAKQVRRQLEERVRERTASLEAAMSDLSEAVDQKDLLMREVNHRVKNSLQLVSSLLSLQSQSAQDEQLRHHLQEAGRRVRAVSDVHNLLYQGDDLRAIPFDDYLRTLCRDLQLSMLGDDGWSLTVEAEPVELPTDDAIPLGLIANELLINAVKHAYANDAGDAAKLIEVSLRRHGRDEMHLVISDRGAGLPVDFGQRRSTSLGMRIIHALVRQIGARLEIGSRNPGASFTIVLPLKRDMPPPD